MHVQFLDFEPVPGPSLKAPQLLAQLSVVHGTYNYFRFEAILSLGVAGVRKVVWSSREFPEDLRLYQSL